MVDRLTAIIPDLQAMGPALEVGARRPVCACVSVLHACTAVDAYVCVRSVVCVVESSCCVAAPCQRAAFRLLSPVPGRCCVRPALQELLRVVRLYLAAGRETPIDVVALQQEVRQQCRCWCLSSPIACKAAT